jgi:hypothetical protein
MSRNTTQAQVQDQAAKAARGAVRVAAPAWVLSYDRATQTATIQIATAYRVQNDDGETVARARPPVSNVPVQFAGSVTWDLEDGEWGLALICDRSIDEWKATASQATEPRDPRRFDITDAVFLAGVQAPASPLPSAAYASGAVVLYDRGTGDVRLGSSSASDKVALDSLVRSEINALWTAISTHIHPGVVVGPLSTGVSTTTGSAGNVGSSVVKADT